MCIKLCSGTPTQAIEPVEKAFQTWQQNTHFTFSRVQGNADLTIGFFRGEHGDGASFDGPGRTIAHAFAPQIGMFHYDSDERWSIGAVPGANDLETVALHEIGHLLGLGHSEDESAIMFPTLDLGTTKGLGQDDINGINALYQV